jgi:hypothetical protein
MPTTGRQVFRDIRRQLTDAELSHPGVQKLLLDNYERAELRATDLEAYVNRFHEADKRAEVLEEKLKTDKSVEVLSSFGMAIGGAILGLSPYFFDKFSGNWFFGVAALVLGGAMMTGSAIGRAMKR